jgi:hypothetical protein
MCTLQEHNDQKKALQYDAMVIAAFSSDAFPVFSFQFPSIVSCTSILLCLVALSPCPYGTYMVQ